MVDSLKFKNLNLEQLNALQEAKSSEECKDMLEKFLKTGSRLDDPRVNIIIDFHFYNCILRSVC